MPSNHVFQGSKSSCLMLRSKINFGSSFTIHDFFYSPLVHSFPIHELASRLHASLEKFSINMRGNHDLVMQVIIQVSYLFSVLKFFPGMKLFSFFFSIFSLCSNIMKLFVSFFHIVVYILTLLFIDLGYYWLYGHHI